LELLIIFAVIFGVWRIPMAIGRHMRTNTNLILNLVGFFRGVAQLASALAWGARGRLFESDHPDNTKCNQQLIS